jgi:hypothetical protein
LREIHTGIELVHAADPAEAGFGKVVQSHQVEVAWKAVNRPDADLMESPEEILGNIDGLLEALLPDILRHLGGGV